MINTTAIDGAILNIAKRRFRHVGVPRLALVWLLVAATLALTACGGGSSGGAPSSVAAEVDPPNVQGMTQAAATAAITNAGLVVGTVSMVSSATVPAGNVISQIPVSTVSVPRGSPVDLTVSSGDQAVVPNVVGMTQAAASTSITGVGLVVGTVTMASSSTVPSGNVLSQSPAAGTQVGSGSSVSLTISSGPALAPVAVPNVIGLTQAAANAAITAAGLANGNAYGIEPSTTAAAGTVISEFPAAGTNVAPNSNVSLTISDGPPRPSGPPVPVSVPNVIGLTQAAAIASITGAQLVAGSVTTVSNSTVAKGSVITQTPAAASTVESFSIVNLTISGGVGGHFAYVGDVGSAAISAFSVDPTSGALTALNPATIQVVPNPTRPGELNGLAVDPSGNFLYAMGNYVDPNKGVLTGLYAYAINPANGSLTPVAGSPFPSGELPEAIAFDASGGYLYLSNGIGISAYSIDPTSGALTPQVSAATDSGPVQMVRSGDYLYVAAQGSNDIDAFTIDGLGFPDANVPGAPFASDNGPTGVVVNPTGSVLYAVGAGSTPGNSESLSGFTINSVNGALTPAGTPMNLPTTSFMTIDPQGKFLILAGELGVYVYPTDSDTGAIGAAVAGSPFSAGVTSAYVPYSISFDPSGKFVYVCNAGPQSLNSGNVPAGAIDVFTLDSNTGALTPVVGSPVAAGTNPSFIVFR
jgi:beta-lactam-binding protein with PASTA domain